MVGLDISTDSGWQYRTATNCCFSKEVKSLHKSSYSPADRPRVQSGGLPQEDSERDGFGDFMFI